MDDFVVAEIERGDISVRHDDNALDDARLAAEVVTSGGESGSPLLSNTEIVLPAVLSTQALPSAETAVPKPGHSMPARGETGGHRRKRLAVRAILDWLPSHSPSVASDPAMKLSPIQALPAVSNMILPGALSPPAANLSGSTHGRVGLCPRRLRAYPICFL